MHVPRLFPSASERNGAPCPHSCSCRGVMLRLRHVQQADWSGLRARQGEAMKWPRRCALAGPQRRLAAAGCLRLPAKPQSVLSRRRMAGASPLTRYTSWSKRNGKLELAASTPKQPMCPTGETPPTVARSHAYDEERVGVCNERVGVCKARHCRRALESERERPERMHLRLLSARLSPQTSGTGRLPAPHARRA